MTAHDAAAFCAVVVLLSALCAIIGEMLTPTGDDFDD